jgi:hypothetical protein
MRALPDKRNCFQKVVLIAGDPMAISHELSSEIAAALLATKQRSNSELADLKEIVFKIHSALEKSTAEDGTARRAGVVSDTPQPENPERAKSKSAGKDN